MTKALKKWKRRQLLKEKCVLYLGGKCKHCEYNKCIAALEFHHRNGSHKSFEIAKAICSEFAWARLKVELDKCDLLCANCHREDHWNTFNDVNQTLSEES